MSLTDLVEIVALAVFALNSLAIYIFFFYHLSRHTGALQRGADCDLPGTVAERRRLLELEGDDGETARKIKLAARLKVAPPPEPKIRRLLKQAGENDSGSIERFQRRTLGFVAVGILLGLCLGIGIGATAAGIALGTFIGTLVPVYEVSRKATEREHQFMISIAALIRPLSITLEQGLDLTTALKKLVTNAGLGAGSDPVIRLFEDALEAARAKGTDIRPILREVVKEVGSPHFTRLCGILQLTDSHAAGWRNHLDQFGAELEDLISLFPAAQRASLPRHRPEQFFPTKSPRP